MIRIRDEDPEFFGGDNARQLDVLILQWIRNLDENARYDVLKPILERTRGITLAAMVVRSFGPDPRREGASDTSWQLPEEQLQSIRSMMLARIRVAAGAGRFWDAADPSVLLEVDVVGNW